MGAQFWGAPSGMRLTGTVTLRPSEGGRKASEYSLLSWCPGGCFGSFGYNRRIVSLVSEFLGMKFGVVYQEGVEPHFRVVYWDWNGPELSAKYGMESRGVIEGWLPQLGMWAIDEWAETHRSQLEQAWEDSRAGRAPTAIAPLE